MLLPRLRDATLTQSGMNVVSLMPLGRVSIFRTPAVRARLGDPPLMTEPNADGSRPLEKCAALDWMAECERMAIRIDTVRGKPSPVLIAARASEVYVCHLDQGMRRYRILIAGFSLVTFGDILVSKGRFYISSNVAGNTSRRQIHLPIGTRLGLHCLTHHPLSTH
jgi:hypothetical protein